MKTEKINGKRVLDVATTSIPMLMTYDNISSFLNAIEDRDDFYLRWLYHLDQYKGLESDWEDTMMQAVKVSEKFDEALLFATRQNIGFGGSVLRLMKEVKRDVFWIEDDWNWPGSFKIYDVIDTIEKDNATSFNFQRRHERIGALCPTYWSFKMVRHFVKSWSGRKKLSQSLAKKIMWNRKFKSAGMEGGPLQERIPKGVCIHLGNDYLKAKGYKCNHAGRLY